MEDFGIVMLKTAGACLGMLFAALALYGYYCMIRDFSKWVKRRWDKKRWAK